MKITKAASVELSGAPSAEQLEKINRLTKKAVTAEEVYVFSVRLCDDQVDRDDERFSESCIRELAALFIGKTGVMDHVWSAEKQVARFVDTEVLAEQAIGYIKTLGECRVRDLCAGSGCIGLAVAAQVPQARVVLRRSSLPDPAKPLDISDCPDVDILYAHSQKEQEGI